MVCCFGEHQGNDNKTNGNVAETTTPPGSPQRGAAPLPSASHASRHTDTHSSPTKRKYVPDLADVEVVKKIKLGEIELRDRNTVLHGIKPNVRQGLSLGSVLC